MKIEIWSDFVCPFCYIGKRRLEMALDEFEHQEYVKIEFKSYELDPSAERNPNLTIHEYLASKNGISLEYAKQLNENVEKQAKAIGLIYNFETMQHTNTFDAHRVAKFAATKKLGKEITERLLHAYFTDSELISDHVTLKRLAIEVGLDGHEIESLLDTKRFSNRVREDEELARQIGVQGVPFFVFNEKYAVSGAQSQDVFAQVLEKIWEEENKNPMVKPSRETNSKTSYCTGEECGLDE